ncbi:unnamed protein product [Boreogadus saida]
MLPAPAVPTERTGARGEKDSLAGSELITGYFPVSVCPELPIEGISFLMGNDIAEGKVTPSLEVLNAPQSIEYGRQLKLSGAGPSQPESDSAVEAYKSLMRLTSGGRHL